MTSFLKSFFSRYLTPVLMLLLLLLPALTQGQSVIYKTDSTKLLGTIYDHNLTNIYVIDENGDSLDLWKREVLMVKFEHKRRPRVYSIDYYKKSDHPEDTVNFYRFTAPYKNVVGLNLSGLIFGHVELFYQRNFKQGNAIRLRGLIGFEDGSEEFLYRRNYAIGLDYQRYFKAKKYNHGCFLGLTTDLENSYVNSTYGSNFEGWGGDNTNVIYAAPEIGLYLKNEKRVSVSFSGTFGPMFLLGYSFAVMPAYRLRLNTQFSF